MSFLIIVSLGGVTFVVSYFVTRDIKINAMENNLAINSRTASSAEASLRTTVAAADLFLELAANGETNSEQVENSESEEKLEASRAKFFERNTEIFAIYTEKTAFVNKSRQQSREVRQNVIDAWQVYSKPSMAKAKSGSFVLENASPFFGFPLMAIFYAGRDSVVCVLFDTETLGESFSGGSVNQSFLVNENGDVLVHAEQTKMLILTSEAENPVFKEMQKKQPAKRADYLPGWRKNY